MSDVKRLPDAAGLWWCKGFSAPVKVNMTDGQWCWKSCNGWLQCRPGQWLPCPAPEWPPEPPPRPKMVWASLFVHTTPGWWVLHTDSVWMSMSGDEWVSDAARLIPHDHPEQSAEESRRILAENNS